MVRNILCLLSLILLTNAANAQSGSKSAKTEITVTAYYSGDEEKIDKYDISQLTHIIFSFCYLKNNKLVLGNSKDDIVIRKLVSLKKKYPELKVLLSLGGWGGCKDCSESFSTEEGRNSFAASVREMLDEYKADGIDLDWEYPAIEGHPGHPWKPEDKPNFTALVKALRSSLKPEHEISFAAGGFTKFLTESVEWEKVMPLVNRVNLMTYDLINGYSTVTGHHTALYSTDTQKESTDNAVQYLASIGVPKNKMVIGAAFYARVFAEADSVNNGVNRPARFESFVPYQKLLRDYSAATGYKQYWDDQAKAPFMYNKQKKLFASFDNPQSIRLKTEYVINQGLDGIMFWELTLDQPKGGLLNEIYKVKSSR